MHELIRPDVEERYEVAGNASNLTVSSERGGSADVLIAAGWSSTRLGMALMRLASEYHGGEASQRRQADATDAMLLRGRLHSLAGVVDQLQLQAMRWGMEEADRKAQAVVLWWLDCRCKRCTGRRYEPIPGAPALSSRACRACGGSGDAPLPHGQHGRKLANHVDDCVQRAREQLRGRLRSLAKGMYHRRVECGAC